MSSEELYPRTDVPDLLDLYPENIRRLFFKDELSKADEEVIEEWYNSLSLKEQGRLDAKAESNLRQEDDPEDE